MPISEAALDGIRANGRHWKHELRMSDLTEKMGEMDESTPDSDVEALTKQIIDRCRAAGAKIVPLITGEVDELEFVADCGIEEVRYAMGNLYDAFDYHRIVVI